MTVVLASSSPRRAELLRHLRLEFDVRSPDIDESRLPGEPPGVYVERMARNKAAAVGGADLVIAADTAVVFEGQVLGKPAHPSEARAMLAQLQDATHDVFTGLAVRVGDDMVSVVDVTEVKMLAMTDMEIADYVDSGEPMDKAGAYGLQGAGGVYVESVHGSPFTVIGLPIHLLPRLCHQVGAPLEGFTIREPV